MTPRPAHPKQDGVLAAARGTRGFLPDPARTGCRQLPPHSGTATCVTRTLRMGMLGTWQGQVAATVSIRVPAGWPGRSAVAAVTPLSPPAAGQAGLGCKGNFNSGRFRCPSA